MSPRLTPLVLAGAALAGGCGGPAPPSRRCTVTILVPPGETGFDVEVRLVASVTCPGNVAAPDVVWDDGTRGPVRSLRIPRVEEVLITRDRAGILPVSPAQGRITVRASAGAASADADVLIAHNQTGVPTVPVGASLYLWGGKGGTVRHVVPGGRGPGFFEDPATGFTLPFEAGRADRHPQDCQRPECHPSEGTAHAKTAHATALARALAAPPRGHDERCLGCHTSGGDFRLPGSFVAVAKEIGFWPMPARRVAPDELPRDLRRLAGVGCIACHGPGRLPEPALRPTIFGAAVCGQCHDQPPRYLTAAEWRTSRMSILRPFAHEADCAGCHSAQAFASRVGKVRFTPPDAATVEPITCAACHDPHGPGSSNPRLLRRHDASAGAGALCAECHRADLGVSPERRVTLRLAPLAPQSELAPPDCVRCHQPHGFRAPPLSSAETAAAERTLALADDARRVLRAALPRTRGCNRAAGPADDVRVVWDRLAIVDAAGRALGDCDGDGRWKGEREDPMLSDAVAAALYGRAYKLALVERDRSRGIHDPARAERLLREARGEDAP